MINKNKTTRWIALSVFWAMVVYMLWFQLGELNKFLHHEMGYISFQISDWLINYEGGFVRRGLIGQILYEVYKICPYSVAHAIVVIYYISSAIFIGCFARLLLKNGISLYILPFSICLFFCIGTVFVGGRRDYIVLLLSFFIYKTYFKYIIKKQLFGLFLMWGLSIVLILSHEAAFFFTFPILIFHWFTSGYQNTYKKKIYASLIVWSIPIATMLMVCCFKGSPDIPYKIWDSWSDCLHRYPLNGEITIGNGPLFLANDLLNTVRMHINGTWLTGPFGPLTFPINIYTLLAAYYFTTRANTIKLGPKNTHTIDYTRLSNIMIVQLVALFPMLGFLSCDLGRVISYWVISSLLFYCLQNEYHTAQQPSGRITKYVNKVSAFAQHWIDQCRCLNSPIVYIVLLVTLPLNAYSGASPWASFPFIPYSVKLALWNWIRSAI